MELSWFDRVVSWISPESGFRRARYRAALEVLSSYDGARTGRRTEGWTTAGTDPNAAIGPDLDRLMQRSRDLTRNDPHGARVASVIANSAVGTGIVPQAETGDEATDKVINEEFKFWSEECDSEGQLDFWGLQSLAVRSIIESGGTLSRLRARRPADGLRVPYQIQLLEVDHVDRAKEENRGAAGKTVQGVEFDPIGRRAAYWLYDQHPGATGTLSTIRNGYQSKRVAAADVVHAYRKLRPGQIHGVPWLAPVMLRMRELGDVDEAAVVKARVAACLALWVEQSEGPDSGLLGDSKTEDGTGQRIETLRPGMILYGRYGEKATAVQPPRDDGYGTFYQKQQQMIAAGVDMFYAQLTGDLASVNYSSFRAGDRDFRGAIDVFRWAFIIPMLCRPWWRRFIDTLVLQGKIREANYGVNWSPPKFLSVDPLKDAQADELRLASGTQHLFDSIAEQGYEPRAYVAKIAEIKKLLDDLGLKFSWMEGLTRGQQDGNNQDSQTQASMHIGAGDNRPGKPNGRGNLL